MLAHEYAVASTGTKKKHLTEDKEMTVCGYRISELLSNRMPEADCQRCWRVYEQRTGEGTPVPIGESVSKVLTADITEGKLRVTLMDDGKTLDLTLEMAQVRRMAEHRLEIKYEGQTIVVPASELYRVLSEYEKINGETDEASIAAPDG